VFTIFKYFIKILININYKKKEEKKVSNQKLSFIKKAKKKKKDLEIPF
jgi:hypothetical protein